MKELIKKILKETKFVSRNEMINKIIDEYDNKGKIISLPDFKTYDHYYSHDRDNNPVAETCYYKNVSFQILSCNFIMGVPHLIIKLLSGKVKAISAWETDIAWKNIYGIIDYKNITRKAFQKWKYYGIYKLNIKWGTDYYDIDL